MCSTFSCVTLLANIFYYSTKVLSMNTTIFFKNKSQVLFTALILLLGSLLIMSMSSVPEILKYEYKIINIGSILHEHRQSMIDSSTNSDMNLPARILQSLSIELEQEGWELVSATDPFYILKRIV